MLKNYFIVALRNFWRNKTFSLINITGLCIGISAALVIFIIVSYDLGFDHSYKDSNRIYRVVSNLKVMTEDNPGPGVTTNLAGAVKTELTGADIVAPLFVWDNHWAKYPTVTVGSSAAGKTVVLKTQKNIVFTNNNFFKLFNYTWLSGPPTEALTDPYQAVLTETGAKLYFPGTPVSQVQGKTLTLNDTTHVTITGIVKDVDQHTDFTFTVFLSAPTLSKTIFKGEDLWNNTQPSSQLFVKLSQGETKNMFTTKLNALYRRHYKTTNDDNATISFGLQPLSDLHFNEDYGNYFDNHLAHKPALLGLFAAAAFLLLLACINFINLTTAQASQRVKEIGIRKTMGSSKKQLVSQFLGETFLLTIIATALSVIITPWLLYLFSDFIPQGVHFSLLKQPGILVFLVVLVAGVSLLSGLYPALVLSSYKPALALKNNSITTGKPRSAWLRKSLTVTQFVIAQVFIIASIVVSRQVSYSLNQGLGFKKDAIIYFRTNNPHNNTTRQNVLLQKLNAIPEVAMVSISTNPPSTTAGWSGVLTYNNGKFDIETDVDIKLADNNYLKLYQIPLLAGNNLPYSDTTNSIIINTTYARALGFSQPQQAIGKFIKFNSRMTPVVGVVADFHQSSFHEAIKPLLIGNGLRNTGTFNIALKQQDANGTVWKTALTKIEKAYKETYPAEDDFQYSFVDDTLAKYYTTEQNISRLLTWATGVSVLISCLGLLALVIFITARRTKEIGIRKITGATVMQLITLLTKDFIKLILLAFVIAVPLTWWGAAKWLQNFAYKTTLSWWIFGLGGGCILLIAFLVMIAKTYRAATANPVKALRTE